MKNKPSEKNNYFILLIVLLCFHLAVNLLFFKGNPLPEGKDSYAHASTFNNFLQIAKTGAKHPFYIADKGILYNLIFISFDYPPLFYFVAYLLKSLLSMIYINAALFTASLFFIILIVSVYKIGLHINKNTGILAAFACSFYPIVHLSSRHFNLELATAAMVALTIWLLIETDLFKNLFFSVCLGISLGLGMLTKQIFIVFVTAPCLFYAAYSLKRVCENKRGRRLKVKNMFIAVSIGVVLSAIFYWNNLVYEGIAARAGFVGAVAGESILSLKHMLYYPFSLYQTIGLFFLLVFFIGLINLPKAGYLYMSLFLIWLLFPIVFLSFFTLKYAEYTISVLPAIALITAAGISALRRRRTRNGLIMVIFIFSFVLYYQIICGNRRLFYSSWDIDKQYIFMALKLPDAANGDNLLVQDVIKEIGNSNKTIGICYDNTDLFFPTFLMKRIFSYTKMNSSIVDFSFNTAVFFKNINNFDMLIYVTRSKNHWLTRQSFYEFIKKLNENCNIRIAFSDKFADDYAYADRKRISIAANLAKKLINGKKEYGLYCYMRFLNENTASYEHVYFYQRKD
ncbi:MAG: glycosyltransferase family 39 protein [Candidatus Omnitrophica bacterium]|nr:glycosyltransferase family 39 protein [Candidatus Omnitrophota bacterium]